MKQGHYCQSLLAIGRQVLQFPCLSIPSWVLRLAIFCTQRRMCFCWTSGSPSWQYGGIQCGPHLRWFWRSWCACCWAFTCLRKYQHRIHWSFSWSIRTEVGGKMVGGHQWGDCLDHQTCKMNMPCSLRCGIRTATATRSCDHSRRLLSGIAVCQLMCTSQQLSGSILRWYTSRNVLWLDRLQPRCKCRKQRCAFRPLR